MLSLWEDSSDAEVVGQVLLIEATRALNSVLDRDVVCAVLVSRYAEGLAIGAQLGQGHKIVGSSGSYLVMDADCDVRIRHRRRLAHLQSL